MRKALQHGKSRPAKLITELLAGGITVTVGGVPIRITLGEAHEEAAARPVATRTKAKTKAAAEPKPRRKMRRRKNRRPEAPDTRDIRGYLATQMEGSTLTALAAHFKVKRPMMKRMLKRMLDKQEVTLFKGSFFNNKRLRQRRVPSRYDDSIPASVPAGDNQMESFMESRPEADTVAPEAPSAQAAPVEAPRAETTAEATPTAPTAVPDPEPEEPQSPESLPYPNAA